MGSKASKEETATVSARVSKWLKKDFYKACKKVGVSPSEFISDAVWGLTFWVLKGEVDGFRDLYQKYFGGIEVDVVTEHKLTSTTKARPKAKCPFCGAEDLIQTVEGDIVCSGCQRVVYRKWELDLGSYGIK